ncbi:MAG: thiol reductant ABC exporter subunit CydD [Gemmatimonadota bacterium]
MRPVDPRLLRHAGAARGCLAVTVLLGLVITGLVLTQAGLLARVLAGAARGTGGRALAGALAALLVVLLARAAATAGGEAAALRAAAAVLAGLHTRAASQRQWQLLARLGGHFLDVVQGLGTLTLFGRAGPQARAIQRATDAHRAAAMSTLRVAFLSALVVELAAALATALVAVEVGLRLLAGHLGYQTALLVLLLTPEAYLPLRAVGAQFHASLEGATAAARACDVLAVPAPRARGTGAGYPADLRETPIALNEVTLRYPGRGTPALHGLSLTIRPGERITVTGPSGAGKSSLLALLLRFAEPTGGRIEAGGADLRGFAPGVWRQQLAWVPQRPHLFAGTAAANIALGQPRACRAAVMAAAELAGAAEFIEALPRGYDTPLGERAARLSAGQRQRIALARAFLRDAPVLLLDEPAAHLDPVTGAAVLDAVEALMARRTVLMVTHSQAWRGGADRVLTLDHGRLVLAAGCLPAATSAPSRLAGIS